MLHILKYTKTFIKNILYNFNNTIVSALNFNILKTNLSKIASKEVKIYVFENYFLKKRSCATVTLVGSSFYSIYKVHLPIGKVPLNRSRRCEWFPKEVQDLRYILCFLAKCQALLKWLSLCLCLFRRV